MQAESMQSNLRDIDAGLAADQIVIIVDSQLPALEREIDARLEESSTILNSRPSLETLQRLETDWTTLDGTLSSWKRDLTARATALDREGSRLTTFGDTWQQTLNLSANATQNSAQQQDLQSAATEIIVSTPPEIVARIQVTLLAIKQTRERVERRRAKVLALQNRVAAQGERVSEALNNVAQVRNEVVNRLFVKDSPPIWRVDVYSSSGQTLWENIRNTLTTQWSELSAYARRQKPNFIIHAMVLLLLVGGLYWARRRVQPWVAAEPSLEGVSRVFKIPIATALVLSILVSGRIYPQAPRLFAALLGAAALVPTVIVLRQLVERHLFPVLNALVVFYFLDQLRVISAALPVVTRVLFLLEMFGGLIFLVWLIRSGGLTQVSEDERDLLWKTVRFGKHLAAVVFLMAFIANALGYVSIAILAGSALLRSAYVAIIFYAAIRILDGLIMFATRVPPLSLLGMIKHKRPLFRRRIRGGLRWIAIVGWILYTLRALSLRAAVVGDITAALNAKLKVGSLAISLGNVLAFLITVWAAFLLSRFLRFMLEEDIYPRVRLARGVPYAISTMVNYFILLVGFLFAVAAMGFDMTRFTILAGAFGVGLGFGLQNIVNNFVSGLILLFERPVNVGDMIQVGQREGRLRRVGMRASIIRTAEGSEVIVPNGQLVSGEVLNWTLSDQHRRLEINVGVAYGTDPEVVIDLLTRMASKHPDILAEPSAETLFVAFGDSALNFQLRAWTNHFERWIQIKSELTIGVNATLRDAGIAIPFPQRDLHIQTADGETFPAMGSEHTNNKARKQAV
jgi:small-conductance mechanosensitive channel